MCIMEKKRKLIWNTMPSKNEILKRVVDCGAVAVIRMEEPEKFMNVVNALYEGGVSVLEITMTVPNALKLIEKVSREMGDKVLVGVGSVLNKKMADESIEAGAKFVVSPILKEEIIFSAHNKNLLAMPGCFSPSEIQLAFEMGADIIKVFPADVLGIEFFKAVRAPMPHLKLMPTGGVTLHNACDWLSAGACAVGIGSALIDKNLIKKNNFDQIKENAKILIAGIQNHKKIIR